jgi:hypothetical protein
MALEELIPYRGGRISGGHCQKTDAGRQTFQNLAAGLLQDVLVALFHI